MSPKPRPRASSSKSPRSPAPVGGGQRLQKVLAAAGIASRRECEVLIADGRVEVDRRTVTELGTRVDPARQEIRVDGTPLPRSQHVYYLVNKPPGVVSTNRDPERRMRVIDLVPGEARLFTIGRLDRSSEGLIIVTNDGELAHLLTHPRYGIPKTYRASVLGFPTQETLGKLRAGVHLAEGVARVAHLRRRGRHARGAELEIVLTEGRNREIRRILARVGHKVLHLRRVAMGPLKLGGLAAGEARRLTTAEVQQLRACGRSAMKQGGAGGMLTDTRPAAARQRGGRRRSASQPSGRGVARKPAAGRGTSGGRSRTAQAGSDAPPAVPHTKTRRPRAGVVLDYDRPRSAATPRAAKKRASGKRRRP